MAVATAELEFVREDMEAQEKRAACRRTRAENWKMVAESAWKERDDATKRAKILVEENSKLLKELEELRDHQSIVIGQAQAEVEVSYATHYIHMPLFLLHRLNISFLSMKMQKREGRRLRSKMRLFCQSILNC